MPQAGRQQLGEEAARQVVFIPSPGGGATEGAAEAVAQLIRPG
jgi:hypothetical protein